MSFTYQYSQPEEYHFSLDSILTPKWIAQYYIDKNISHDFRVLDLCAGCGVMGFELAFHLRGIQQIDFLEVQEIYRQHFEENLKRVNRPELHTNFLRENYEVLQEPKFQNRYDLILCNPPYFQVGQGKLSPSEFKNRCRFFIDSDFRNLIISICSTLKKGGDAFVLIRPLADHNLDLVNEMISILPQNFSYAEVADIRGTKLFLLKNK